MRIALTLLVVMMATAPGSRSEEPLILVTRPTVIAFFPPVDDDVLARDPDTKEALTEFRERANRVREPLKNAGVDFHELYVRSFRVRRGKSVERYVPTSIEFGYYLVSPEKAPTLFFGVDTDLAIFEIVRQCFGVVAKPREASR